MEINILDNIKMENLMELVNMNGLMAAYIKAHLLKESEKVEENGVKVMEMFIKVNL
jgi:hypothetical protein